MVTTEDEAIKTWSEVTALDKVPLTLPLIPAPTVKAIANIAGEDIAEPPAIPIPPTEGTDLAARAESEIHAVAEEIADPPMVRDTVAAILLFDPEEMDAPEKQDPRTVTLVDPVEAKLTEGPALEIRTRSMVIVPERVPTMAPSLFAFPAPATPCPPTVTTATPFAAKGPKLCATTPFVRRVESLIQSVEGLAADPAMRRAAGEALAVLARLLPMTDTETAPVPAGIFRRALDESISRPPSKVRAWVILPLNWAAIIKLEDATGDGAREITTAAEEDAGRRAEDPPDTAEMVLLRTLETDAHTVDPDGL